MTAYILVLLVLIQVSLGKFECTREITVNINGNDTEDCLEGDYPCSSLGYVLNHLQSNDCVNITSNSVLLTTIVELHNLNAITIRGQGNTIVTCNNTGGVSCNNCGNIIVESITWDSCGDPNVDQTYSHFGGINFNTISNLSIINCTFQHSRVRALSLTSISGLIEIVHTHFLSNANYGTIYCANSQHNFIQCTATDFKVTGAMRIQDVLKEATVNISNCLFDHNGHLGVVNDIDYREVPCFNCEVADGAGLLLVSPLPNVAANIFIENTNFSFNRGRSGAGALIKTQNSPHIVLTNVIFNSNSVFKFYINASALSIRLVQTPWNYSVIEMSTIQLSSCQFHDNSGRRNMLSYNIEEVPSYLVIDNCEFFNNLEYDITLVELNMNCNGSVEILNSNFDKNSGTALMYFQIRNENMAVSINNVTMTKNTGFATEKTGGLILMEVSQDNCTLRISELNFMDNHYSSNGGGLYITGTFETIFKCYVENSHFENNFGFGDGSVIYSSLRCATEKTYLMFIDNCMFTRNQGNSIVYASMEYYVLPAFLILNGIFSHNDGTALKLFNAVLVGKGTTVFEHNEADTGAALYLSDSYILLNYTSYQFHFVGNSANQHGGAIFVDFVLSNVDRSQCHWLFHPQSDFCTEIFHETNNCTTVIYSGDFCNEVPKNDAVNVMINIANNTALLSGQAIFYDDAQNFQTVRRSSNTSDPNSMFYIPESFTLLPYATEPLVLATQPEILELGEPAKCNNDSTGCNITGITLGQEIRVFANITGYNNKRAEATRFFIECIENCDNYTCTSDFVLIVGELRGISIAGHEVTQNALMSLRLHSGMVSLKLIIDLVPCQLGYMYDPDSHQCMCYHSDENTVTCVDNTTTIKKEYWFGEVDGSRTVSKCPEKYCNFSRVEDTPSKYVLPVGYDDQCNVHRDGPACGECSGNYTLSFDFDDCVEEEDCSIGITFLVIICTVLYWILIVVIALGVMYFKINLGYLYGIIYYYSVVDILLGQIVHFSSGLDIVEKVIFSIIRLSPGFLGKLCFIKGMSGIDQYSLHYIHPTAISLILVLLAIFARCSRRFALFISRGIIHVICLILTLTYTSIADTSLQLFRWLQYEANDNVYCYLSPHMKYLNGRHIVYFIIAVLFESVIVLGLPLLLLVEPFINSRINFIRIKPILDQFQGCYKDKYRWFAAIYFLCRQVILFIVVITSDQFISLYLLAIVCVVLALSHFLLQPYGNNALNRYDGIVLQLLLLVVSLQIISVSKSADFQENAISGVAYGLLFLPLLAYIILSMYIKKDDIYSVMRCLCGQCCKCLFKDDNADVVPTATTNVRGK